MSKKDALSSDLLRGRNLKKQVVITDEEAGKVVEKVVATPAEPVTPVEPSKSVEQPSQPDKEQDLVRTTMDLPRYIHTAIKIKSAQDQLSLKDYIVKLVKNDLNLE